MKCHAESFGTKPAVCKLQPACEHACAMRVRPAMKDSIPSIGPGIATSYPMSAWSRLPPVNLEHVWKIVGGNVDKHMNRHPLWKVFCMIYLEGLAHGSAAERERKESA